MPSRMVIWLRGVGVETRGTGRLLQRGPRAQPHLPPVNVTGHESQEVARGRVWLSEGSVFPFHLLGPGVACYCDRAKTLTATHTHVRIWISGVSRKK